MDWLDIIKDLVITGYTLWKWYTERAKSTNKKRSRPSKSRKR